MTERTGHLHRDVGSRETPVESKLSAGGYVVANGVDREEADRLRNELESAVVSRNADGTYRVTRSR